MRETTFYERLLGIERPWRVHDVQPAAEKAGDVDAVEHAFVRGGVLPDGGDDPADSDLRDGPGRVNVFETT